MKIYILTGAIRTGKTTSLIEWRKNRDDVYGILTPVINQKRIFMNVEMKKQFNMEAETGEENALSIGKYKFSKASFDHASDVIRESLSKSGWLIVDEVGPLELSQQGFYEVIKEIIASENTNMKAIFVIRDSILEKTLNFFQLNDYEIFNFPE